MKEKIIKAIGRQAIHLLMILATVSLVTACRNSQGNGNAPDSIKTYDVQPVLREFYVSLGGEVILGPAISAFFPFNELECQYTANALMCLNPSLAGESRYGLYPLGDALEIEESPVLESNINSSRVVDGISIYEDFIPLYDQFSGARFAGSPLTSARMNYSQQRIEQFFSNVGFFHNFNDPPGTIKLLAYGALACGEECSYTPDVQSTIIHSSSASGEQPFLLQMGEMDAQSIFGEPLTQPYIASDGALEQVYANAVLYSLSGVEDQVFLRPLPLLLELPRTDPVEKIYGNEDGVVFYAVGGGLGYHVPLIFDDFISKHGGLEVSGNPTSEIYELENQLYRQCMENYCLEFRPESPVGEQVSLSALGSLYLAMQQKKGDAGLPLVISGETVSITLKEQFKKLPVSNPQRIEILIINKQGQKPLSGIEASLDMLLPDGEHYTADFSATGEDGTASLIIPVMSRVANGSIITYSVCLKISAGEPVCAESSYLVWNSP